MHRASHLIPLFGAALSLCCPWRAEAQVLTFENDQAVLVITHTGACKSLLEKATGRECLGESLRPLAWVRKAGKFHHASAAAREGDVLRLAFGDSGVEARLRVEIRPRYFIFEIVDLAGDGIEEFCFVQFDGCQIREHLGWWLNVAWDDRSAVCLMGLSDRVNTGGLRAIVDPEFGMKGQRAALVAAPTPALLDIVQQVEREQSIPTATIGGVWAKRSEDVRRGYLFTDLTEANAEETIRYAKLGEFAYIMTYDGTWASSLGSYPINLKNFPGGEESLRATVGKCHSAGLKVGLHMLTSFVHKHDPLVRPKPDPRLLKDARATLATDLDAAAAEIPAAEALDAFPSEAAFYGAAKQGFDIQIDDEIIRYVAIGGPDGKTFLGCVRGHAGTVAAPHRAGATIHHLAERYGCYLVDLRTSLKDELADRIAGVINRCGFDMIYFDGGECNAANGPYWYWVTQQQMAIYQRVRRDLLVQGSGGTPWTWHIFCRGACDDFAALAPKQYLDHHKIADSWRHYTDSFMPAELGWWGFFDDRPDRPATTPDEAEYYAVRMLALDTPVSLETNLAALKRNGRTDEMLSLLGRYERLRLDGDVSAELRARLREGEWHWLEPGGRPVFAPIRYDAYRADAPGEIPVRNPFGPQPLRFRLQAVPTLAPPGDAANVVLVRAEPPAELPSPRATSGQSSPAMPGALAARIDFTQPAANRSGDWALPPGAATAGGEGRALDLLRHRALAVRLRVDAFERAADEPPPVLNVQLEAGAKTYREHYIDLDFSGQRVVILPEPTTERTLAEFRPSHANYEFKSAMYGFNYGHVVALNFRWMRLPKQGGIRCAIASVEALAETDTKLGNPEIAIGERRMVVGHELATGDYAEFHGEGPIRVFDRNGALRAELPAPADVPTLPAGPSALRYAAAPGGPAKLMLITLGEPIGPVQSSPEGGEQPPHAPGP